MDVVLVLVVVIVSGAVAVARFAVVLADQPNAKDAGDHRRDEADDRARHGRGEAEERMRHQNGIRTGLRRSNEE